MRKYREFVYETGAVDAGKRATIDPKIVHTERKRKYRIRRVDRFINRTRYFTDAGIIGSPVKSCPWQGACGPFHQAGKEFVGEVFDQVKSLLGSKDERRFTPVGGVEGLYSMKRLGAKY